MYRGPFAVIAVILLCSAVVFSASTASAVDRDDGEWWKYQAMMRIAVGPYDVQVSGNITYQFEGDRTMTIPGYGNILVNVISVHGELSGEMELLGEPYVNASLFVSGYHCEATDDLGIVEDATTMLTNATMGSGPFSFSMQTEVQTVLVYSPAYMDGVDPDDLVLGESRTASGAVNKLVRTYENGTLKSSVPSDIETEYSIAIDSSVEPVETSAGTFDAVKITIATDSGYELRWWSDEVDGFVMIETYSAIVGGFEQTLTLSLAEYHEGDVESMLWVILAGVAFAIVAGAILLFVLTRQRNPKVS